MSIIFRVGQMIMLVMMTLWLLFGAGVSWVAWKARNDLATSSSESARADNYMDDDEANGRPSYYDEYDRERRRERDGVRIDTDSAKPMVDLDRAHRY